MGGKEPTDSELYREYTTASYEKDRLQQKYDAAKAKADKAKNESDGSIGNLHAYAEAFNVVVEATNNGIAVVDAKEEKEVNYEALKAVEILKSVMPKTSNANLDALNALVAKQEAVIEKAEAILKAADKKVALVSTAFASEEVTAEEVDALIEELDSNTEAIKDEMKKLDGEVAEDSKEEDKADDKKEDAK